MLRTDSPRKKFPLGWWLALAIGGITLIGGAGIWFASPRAQNFSPQGENLSALTPISIQFTQEMNRTSVERGFKTDPQVEGAFAWQGNTITFTPIKEFKVGVVQVTLTGARSANNLPLLGATAWQFNVPSTSMAFLFKINEVANLWVYPLGEDRLIQMTSESVGVGEYAISPDGAQIIFTALRADGGADLKRVSRDGKTSSTLYACPNELCAFPVFSFDGKLLAFEHTRLGQTNTRLEILDLATNKTVTPPLVGNEVARSPLFARDGKLAFVSVTQQTTLVYNFATRALTKIANTSGEVGSWSPDSQQLIFAEIFFTSINGTRTPDPNVKEYDKFYSNILQATVTTNALKNLTTSATSEDGSPVYAPNGNWIAFSRRNLVEAQWSPGRQLWLMQTDGSQARAITNDPFYNHSSFAWNPSGNTLLYMRFDMTEVLNPSEIWQVNADGSGQKKLIRGGYLPQWLP